MPLEKNTEINSSKQIISQFDWIHEKQETKDKIKSSLENKNILTSKIKELISSVLKENKTFLNKIHQIEEIIIELKDLKIDTSIYENDLLKVKEKIYLYQVRVDIRNLEETNYLFPDEQSLLPEEIIPWVEDNTYFEWSSINKIKKYIKELKDFGIDTSKFEKNFTKELQEETYKYDIGKRFAYINYYPGYKQTFITIIENSLEELKKLNIDTSKFEEELNQQKNWN